jgi:predicted nucleic acid-binding protein
MPLFDSMIAATARANGLVIVTRVSLGVVF